MKALLKNFHQSPRKVRLVANAIRGKSVPQARTTLQFLPQKSSPVLLKLLDSAVANARQVGAAPEELVVKTITVNKGMALKRFAPRARGRAARFARTMSIVAIELGTNAAPKKALKKIAAPKADATEKTEKKPAAKKAAKKAALGRSTTTGEAKKTTK